MKGRIQVQSKLDNEKIGKLSYIGCGVLQIIEDLGSDSYYIKRYNDSNSAIRKYKGTHL